MMNKVFASSSISEILFISSQYVGGICFLYAYKHFIYFVKSSKQFSQNAILDVWQSSKYAFEFIERLWKHSEKIIK